MIVDKLDIRERVRKKYEHRELEKDLLQPICNKEMMKKRNRTAY